MPGTGHIQKGDVGNTRNAKTMLRRFKERHQMTIGLLNLIMDLRSNISSQGSGSDSDNSAEYKCRQKIAQVSLIDGAIGEEAMNNIRRATRRIYGKETSLKIMNHCLGLYKKARIDGEQWENIYETFSPFITDNALNARDGKETLYSENKLIEKIDELHKTEKDKFGDAQQHEKEIREKDKQLALKHEVIHEKDVVILEKDKQLALEHEESLRKDKMLLEKDEMLLEKDKVIHEKDEQFERERERFLQQIALLEAQVASRSRSPSSSSPTNPTLFSPTKNVGKKREHSSSEEEVSKRHKAGKEPDESSKDYDSPPSPKTPKQ